jgi:hypothetical protein
MKTSSVVLNVKGSILLPCVMYPIMRYTHTDKEIVNEMIFKQQLQYKNEPSIGLLRLM